MEYDAVTKGFHWAMNLAGAETALRLIEEQSEIERIDLQQAQAVSNMQAVKVLDSLVELGVLGRSRRLVSDPWRYHKGELWESFVPAHKKIKALHTHVIRNSRVRGRRERLRPSGPS